MPESQQQPKKLDSARAMQITVGILCLCFFFSGLGDVVNASESGRTISLVLGFVQMVFGGFGAALTGWSVMRNRT
jgi:hypothetical protein